MKISFLKKHYIWIGILWLASFASSLLVRVEMQYLGGLEGEYTATYGFPFAVASRQYDMWIPTLKQFDVLYLGVLLNAVLSAFLVIGIMTVVLFVVQFRKK
jgi:hypothetical protein